MTVIRDIIKNICSVGPSGFDSYSPNRIANFYRRGENLRTLVPLLTHKDPQIASAGAWIASEVVGIGRGREIFDELFQMLYNPDPAVRFWPISAVACLATASDTAELQKLITLIADENIGVRNQALRYLGVIPISSLSGLKDPPIVRLLLPNANKDDLLVYFKSDNAIARRLAIAGAMRNFSDDHNFLSEMLAILNNDEKNEVKEIQRMIIIA